MNAVFENIFGILISTVLMGGFAVSLTGLYMHLKICRTDLRDMIQRVVCPKKAKPEDHYLVVCRTKKQAIYWRRRLLDNITDCYRRDEIKVINNYGKYICLYFPKTHMIVRFISEKEYFEASTGFHGWVVEQSQVEDWIRAAETKEQ